MLTVFVWVAWLTFANGGAFGVLMLSSQECASHADALVTFSTSVGIPAERTPCERVAVTTGMAVETEDD